MHIGVLHMEHPKISGYIVLDQLKLGTFKTDVVRMNKKLNGSRALFTNRVSHKTEFP